MEELAKEVERIFDKAKHEAVGLMLAHRSAPASLPPLPSAEIDPKAQQEINAHRLLKEKAYLTKKEVALYLGVSERSITEWMARATNENPLPAGAVGGDPRFYREQVDKWVEREGQRRKLKLAV